MDGRLKTVQFIIIIYGVTHVNSAKGLGKRCQFPFVTL